MTFATLERIEEVCRERRVKLTPQRRRVLQILLDEGRPMGAYDIMRAMDQQAEGTQRTAPPTVYRVLEFLQGQGFIHRIASLQAYVPCAEPEREHAVQFLICTDCGRVDELDDKRLDRTVQAAAAAHGFKCDKQIEVTSRCDDCDAPSPKGAG